MLIAAFVSRAGVCAELLEDVLTHHELILSDFIIDEVTRKLREKFDYPENEIRELRGFLSSTATLVLPAPLPNSVCRDPQDIPVLGTAVAGNADLLISVDKDLLSVAQYQGIAIIKPGQFWKHALI